MSNETTATLIPFDRIFRLSGHELKEDYRINLFSSVKKENLELIGMFGEAEEEREVTENETENENENENEQGEDHPGSEEEEVVEAEMKKMKKKKITKKMKELDYDLDDPFIDDSEITDVYQSVFELMRGNGGGGGGTGDGHDSEDAKNEDSKLKLKSKKREGNFFVYRGTMTPEILAKEFEIDPEELSRNVEGLSGDGEGAGGADGTGNEFGDGRRDDSKRKKNKRKLSSSGTSQVKKVKTVEKLPAVKKEQKLAKLAKSTKPTDLIAQSVKKYNDLFSNEDPSISASVAVAVKPKPLTPVFNVNGVDANLLELRVVIKKFRDSAVGTPFSPGKFPSALRPRLNETICSVLRLCRPTSQSILPVKMFSALASFLPFSPAALNKLMVKKILGSLMESLERSELPKLYAAWKKIVEGRCREEGAIVEAAAAAVTVTMAGGESVTVASEALPSETAEQINVPSADPTQQQISLPASPVKKKLKFNDEMRQQVFDIIRSEIDLNNLILLTNLTAVATAIGCSASIDNLNDVGVVSRAVQSDLNLRKNVYQKLVSMSCAPFDMGGVALLSTTDISKEFGSQKRKHEKKIAKAAGEILFGEGDIEEFLRELDVKTATGSAVPETETVPPVTADPLNLFTDQQQQQHQQQHQSEAKDAGSDATAGDTSLFIDSNNPS